MDGLHFIPPYFLDILDNQAYNEHIYSIIENGGENVPRLRFHTLTEQMFYILLCLKQECYGMDILDRVPAMTNGRVNVGSGTLYHLLEQFLREGMIRETKVEGRRRSYILTEKGKRMLEDDYNRIKAQVADYEND
jgi:DNA-binding PadR family transcriptional regulator